MLTVVPVRLETYMLALSINIIDMEHRCGRVSRCLARKALASRRFVNRLVTVSAISHQLISNLYVAKFLRTVHLV